MRHLVHYIFMLLAVPLNAQLVIERYAGVHLQENSQVYIHGDFISFSHVSGQGCLYFSGDSVQSINANGFNVPLLVIESKSAVQLRGDIQIQHGLKLSGATFWLNDFDAVLAENATILADNDGKIVTNLGGVVRKHLITDIKDMFVPLGTGRSYTPVVISTKGKYFKAFVEVFSTDKPSSNRPVDLHHYSDKYWKVNTEGFDGLIDVIAETSEQQTGGLSGYVWHQGKWTASSKMMDGRIISQLKPGLSEIYAMNLTKRSIYPNPVVYATNLKYASVSDTKAQIIITDSRGRIVKTITTAMHKGMNNIAINVHDLLSGHYDVTIRQGAGTTTLKMVKK